MSLNYRLPNEDATVSEKDMKSILSKNDVIKKEVILMGDFNINLLDFDKNKRVQSFWNLMFQFSMIPTAIDNIFTNIIMDNTEIKRLLL